MKQISLSILITVALLLGGLAKSMAQTGTVVFTGTDYGNMGTILHDGTSSNDITGIQLNIFGAMSPANATARINSGSFVFFNSLGVGNVCVPIDVTSGNSTVVDNNLPRIIVIMSNDGSEFNFKSIYIGDYIGSNSPIKFEGFRNGISTGSVVLTINTATYDETFTSTSLTPSIFQNVDEVRISNQVEGDMAYGIYAGFNKIEIAPAVVPAVVPPTVTTQAVSNISTTFAWGNGLITVGTDITEIGVYWSTTDGFADGTGTKVFSTVNLSAPRAFANVFSGLSPSTTYYVKAFATNSAGTGYGNQVSFTTASAIPTISSFTPNSACPGTTITISGTNFTGASSVSFGGTEATSFSVVNATTITAVVANGTSGSVAVTTSNGVGTKTGFTMNSSIPGTLTYNSAVGQQTIVSDGQAGSADYCGITLNVYAANSGLTALTNAMTYEANIYPGLNGLAANYSTSAGSDYIIIKSSNNSVNFSLQSLQLIDYGGNNVKIEGFDNNNSTGSINFTTNTNPFYFTLNQSGVLTPIKFQNIDEVRISGQAGTPIWIAVNNIQLSPPISSPVVSSVSVPANGTYKIGDNLNFTVNFSEAISVNTLGGTPYIPITLNTGGTVNASYVSGSGTTALVFRYTVTAGNLDNNGISIGSAIMANGGTLKNSGATNANLTLNSVGSTSGVLVDGVRPTASVVIDDTALRIGETSSVTITFSEAVTGFTNADLNIANGTLSAVSSSDGGITWTATLTPTPNITDATNVITLDNTGITDASGNAGTGTTDSNNYAVDTQRPTANIVVADNSLRIGETSSVTITFSEAVTGFTNADLTIANGSLSAVSSSDGGVTWTATFTPTANVTDATNVITLDNTGVADVAGNAGTGTTDSNNYAIDTQRPTASVVIDDTALRIGETSSVTITFSEAVTGFTNADITIANGTLSAVSSSDGGVTWTATFTPTANVTDATNVITLDNTGVADVAGNAGTGTTDSNNYAIDTQRPTATIVLTDNALRIGETSLVTITFSEAVTGFTNADLTVANGSLTSVTSSDGGITWTATFTPTASVTYASNVITLDNTGVVDLAGNAGTGTTNSNNYSVDTVIPFVSNVSSTTGNGTYKLSDVITITITFSEAVTVTGTPALALNSGGSAYYIAGSGTSVLTFNYTVGNGENSADLDYSATSSLALSGGTINDLIGNSATLTLPAVGGANSLGGQKNFVISMVPTVTTQAVSGISTISATGNGNITVLGLPNPTAYGFCWNTTGTPTTADSKVDMGATSATGAFTASITGLTAGTTYYVRAFAINSAGTSYGNQVNFTTANLIDQTINFGTLSNKTYGDASFTISASGGASGNPVVFTSSNPTVATCTGTNGTVITILKAGSTTIYANQAGNSSYKAATQTSQLLTINKKSLNVTAVTDTKTYDGTTASAGTPTVGTLASGDVVATAPTQVFDNANVGTTHELTASGLTIKNGSNVDVTGNYNITYVASSATGTINKMNVNVTAVTDNKTYNGTTASAGSPIVGTLASGDIVNTAPTQVFDNANVGTTHVLTASGLTIKNGSNVDVTGNYNITYVASPATGTINKMNVSVTAVTDTKTYDGTTTSTGNPTVGTLASSDVVNVAPTQIFDNANAGTTHVLTASGLTIKNGSNADVTGNYNITYIASPATGIINKMNVSVTAVTDTKTYNATTASVGSPIVGTLASGDIVNTAPTQVFDNANVGTTHVLTASGLTIKNSSNVDVTGNYNITYVASPATGTINKMNVSVTAVTDTKTYNANTASTGSPIVGTLASGDIVNAAPTQVFDNANVGTTHVLTASGLTIKNSSNVDVTGNYNITYVASPATGTINKMNVSVTAVTDTKTYNANTASTGSPIVGTLASGDIVNAAPTQVFDNANVGTTHVLTASGLTIKNSSNVDVTGNYNITYLTSPATGTINKMNVNVTAVTDTKTYDGTTASAGSPTVGTLASGDAVATAPTQVFDNANVGTTNVLTASGLTIKNGSNADVTGNYNITYLASPATGIINKMNVSVTAVTDTKTYNGTTASTGSPTVGTLASGDVVATAPTQVFDNANVGTTHVLTASGLAIKNGSNADVTGNYNITYLASPATGIINKKTLSVVGAIAQTKIYDGNTIAVISGATLNGVEGTDNVLLANETTGAFAQSGVGTNIAVTTSMTITGTAIGNYSLVQPTGLKAGINPLQLSVSDPTITKSKVYDGNDIANVIAGFLLNVLPADKDNVFIEAIASYSGENTGNNKTITVKYIISGSAAANYIAPADYVYSVIDAQITPKQLTISDPVVVINKMIDGNTSAEISSIGSLQGVEAVDVNNLGVTAIATYDDANVGINKVITVVYTLTGSTKDNYIAPANFVINGAKISDNITLSTLATPTPGCEAADMNLDYTILSGTPTQYKITFSTATVAAGIVNVDYTALPTNNNSGVLAFNIPKGTKEGVYQGVLKMRNELGTESNDYPFEFSIKLSSDYIISKFDDVVLVDNSSNRFTSYQWYKNGTLIEGAQKQFYADPLGLVGNYSVRVTTTDGQTLYSCDKELNMKAPKSIRAYPNPVKATRISTIYMVGYADKELEDATMRIYNAQGQIVYYSPVVTKNNQVELPDMEGVYIGIVRTRNGKSNSFKVIVEK
jgi:hypothetical protein